MERTPNLRSHLFGKLFSLQSSVLWTFLATYFCLLNSDRARLHLGYSSTLQLGKSLQTNSGQSSCSLICLLCHRNPCPNSNIGKVLLYIFYFFLASSCRRENLVSVILYWLEAEILQGCFDFSKGFLLFPCRECNVKPFISSHETSVK